ncbi:MAG TPA: hypothetical protein VGW10_01955, partial [Solirubrobacteraceae bacterium]|nr:hypothetical protein [Solirubrobacteraceae bacterium]
MAVSASGAARAPARATLAGLAARVWTPRVVVPLVFALSAAWFAWQASHVSSYIWLIDEMLYVKQAHGYSELAGLMPHVHGEPYGVPNVLYPLLMAPLYALLSSPDAFEAAHILNGLLWTSALFPVYLLVRRLGASWQWALLAGILTIWVPWSVATLVVMTEAATYAVFPWAILAITIAVAEPRPRNHVLAVAAILLAVAARTQMVFLFGVLVLAAIAFEVSVPDGVRLRERLRRRWSLIAILGGGALLLGAVAVLGGKPLGGYELTASLERFPGGLWGSAVQHAAHVFVGLAVIPPIMFFAWLYSVAAEPRGPLERSFALVAAITLVLIFYQAAFFAQLIAAGMQERYVSYAVPILVVGAVLLAADRLRGTPRLSLLASGLLVAGVIAGAPFDAGEAAGAFDRVANGGAALGEVFMKDIPELTRSIPGRDLRTNEGL